MRTTSNRDDEGSTKHQTSHNVNRVFVMATTTAKLVD